MPTTREFPLRQSTKWIDKGEVRGVKIGIFNFVMLELDEAKKIKERKVSAYFKG
jgi:hypothetical protein